MQAFLLLFAVIPAAIAAQCASEDDPMCPYWVANGFCSSWGFPQSMLQEYCPKAWTNTGCNCPAGSILVGLATNNNCSTDTLTGSVCCLSQDTPSNVIGTI